MLLLTGDGGPCFRCLVPEPPPSASVDTCDTAGVIGSATHTIASLQATEAIKWLSGNHEQTRVKLISLDLWNNRIRELKIPKQLQEHCLACGKEQFEFLDGDRAIQSETTAVLCGREAVQIQTNESDIDFEQISNRWQSVGRVQVTRFFVRLYLSDQQNLTLFRDGRVVVNGTDQISEARSLVSRFLGG